jgi:hypothetical protein
MIRLMQASRAWGTPEFNAALKRDVERLDPDTLPLQQGLSMGSHVLDKPVSAMVIAASEADGVIRAKVGIFYASILAGCACADDPTPVSENSEYCVVRFDIDRASGEARLSLVDL